MSEKGNIPNAQNTETIAPTDTTKATEGPILLEIKAAVEKLAGDVRGLTERMNKQDKKPEDKYPPPCKSCDELAAEAAEKAKKPEEKLPPEPKKQEPPAPPSAEDHGCGPDEEWDGKACVPKASKAAKPEKPVPYPEEPKKSLELINAQMNEMTALKEEVSSLRKCLGIAPFKRTTVVRKEDLNTPVDVSKMSYAQLHELARPVDMRRMA